MGAGQLVSISVAPKFSPSCIILQSQAGLSRERPRRRCCIDTKPRKFDAESANLLCNFAEMVVREIEKEKARVRHRWRCLLDYAQPRPIYLSAGC